MVFLYYFIINDIKHCLETAVNLPPEEVAFVEIKGKRGSYLFTYKEKKIFLGPEHTTGF